MNSNCVKCVFKIYLLNIGKCVVMIVIMFQESKLKIKRFIIAANVKKFQHFNSVMFCSELVENDFNFFFFLCQFYPFQLCVENFRHFWKLHLIFYFRGHDRHNSSRLRKKKSIPKTFN